jgi:8-oxo-dGTP diphosphatase / 2-hydroxy-dATP diphosphatase
MTLVLLYESAAKRVLLAMKKRGFGEGRWNGYGGKVQEGEAVPVSAARELEEEAGISGISLTPAGLMHFEFPAEEKLLEVHLFRNSGFTGTAVETDEMRPQWFNFDDVPYSQMWPDDKIWLPEFLAGRDIEARFVMGDIDTILKYDLKTF